MAKILNVSLQSIPEVIIINDDDNDLTVLTEVEFHDLDIKLEMEYYLHLFVYDIHGDVDAPLVIPNWDDSEVLSIALDRKDDYLGVANVCVTANKKRMSIKTAMSLKLGKQSHLSSHYSKKLEVFATIAPAIGRASKWSLPFKAKIEY